MRGKINYTISSQPALRAGFVLLLFRCLFFWTQGWGKYLQGMGKNPKLFKEKMKMRRSNTKMIRNYRPIGIDGIGTPDGGDML